MIQKDRREFEISVHHRHIQGAGSIGRSIVRVCAMGQQRQHRSLVSVADGEQQRGKAALRFRFDFGPKLDQQLGCGCVAFRCGPHERRLAANGLLHIDLSAVCQQKLDGIDPAVQRRQS